MKSRQHSKILEWSDEVAYGNGHIITSAYGWAFEPDDDHNSACHIRGFDTAKEARAYMKWVQPCRCLRCTTKGHEDAAIAKTEETS